MVYYSFSKLSSAAQNMFLDSVTVLLGQPESKALLVWEAWWPGKARQALRKLKQLSLVSLRSGGFRRLQKRVTALDVIRSLGQSILLQPDRANRFSDAYVGSRVWVVRSGVVQGLTENHKVRTYKPIKESKIQPFTLSHGQGTAETVLQIVPPPLCAPAAGQHAWQHIKGLCCATTSS